MFLFEECKAHGKFMRKSLLSMGSTLGELIACFDDTRVLDALERAAGEDELAKKLVRELRELDNRMEEREAVFFYGHLKNEKPKN